MKHLIFKKDKVEKLPFYLAAEEYFINKKTEDHYFFLWQVNPTVIFGRNQVMEKEVNLDYTEKEKIEVYRRKSGGGCVYSDMKNIMFSFIIPADFQITYTFDRYIKKMVEALRSLGISAKASGRNDILVDNYKVSGSSFFKVGKRCVVHGTLLFETDFSQMAKCISPDITKLESKGVDSVKQRVTNLSNFTDLDIESFKEKIVAFVCDEEYAIDESDYKGIQEIEVPYYDSSFIQGKNPKYLVEKSGYCLAGGLDFRINVTHGIIKGLNLVGDFFLVGNLDELLHCFIGVDYTDKAVEHVLKSIRVGRYIKNCTNEDFKKILIGKK